MPRYNVHLYREMRLFFENVEADNPEEALKKVMDTPADQAECHDCEGENLSALVDVVGDPDYKNSVDFSRKQLDRFCDRK